MSVIDKVTVGGTTYDLQDTKAQSDCADLKSAVTQEPTDLEKITGARFGIWESGYHSTVDAGSAVEHKTSANFRTCLIPTSEGEVITLDATGGASTQRLYVWLDSSGNAVYASGKPAANLSGLRTLTTPANAVAIAINNHIGNNPSGYYAYIGKSVPTQITEAVATKQNTLTFDAAPTASSTNPVTSGGVKTAIDAADQLTHDSAVYGGVAYWPVNPASGSTSTSFAVSQSGAFLLVNGTHSTSVAFAKLDKTFSVDNGTTTTGPSKAAACSKDTVLKAGRTYKFSAEALRGTYTGGAASSKVVVRLYDSASTLLKEFAVGVSYTITPQADTTVSVIFYSYGANNEYTNYKVLIRLEESLVDTTPTENSKNPITSGAVYDIVQSLPEDETIPSYYFTNDYLQGKIDTITGLQNTMSVNNDAFWFISDYHEQHNEKHSIPLLKYLMKRTGITRLIYGGDAGGSAGTSQSSVYNQIQKSAEVWQKLDSITKQFYGVLGNHEYINSTYGKLSGMMGAYLNRYKDTVVMDAATGCYYVDNTANKIRMFFLQVNASTYPVSGTIDWFKNQLLEVPKDYSIMVVMHYGYVPNTVTNSEFNGYDPAYGHVEVKDVSELLAGCRGKADMRTAFDVDFRSLTGERHIIGVFSGHIHHGYLYTEGTVEDIKNVAVFEASTDSLLGGLQQLSLNGHPWYWENGTVGGTQIERTAGAINEQCFYAVQIDMDAKMLYITAIGGDHDWSGCYEPASATTT